jgi:signal transduction histidine kinase
VAQAAVEHVLAGRATEMFEVDLVSKSGAIRQVRWHATPLVTDEVGAHAGFIGLDITEERELERRTRRAEQLAGLGALSAGLAHEIRNPLNAAQLQLMLVERRLAQGDDGARRQAATDAASLVRVELERLAGLVQDFLSFARPSELRRTDCDLQETVRTVVQLLAPDAAAAGTRLSHETSGPLQGRYDEDRIKQVLLNLARNALEACGRDGAVRILLRQEDSEAVLEVEDTGPGVPPDLDVFAPFATSKDRGTGLGLPIVQRIVIDHGGDVTFARRGDRTVFAVRLPLGRG